VDEFVLLIFACGLVKSGLNLMPFEDVDLGRQGFTI